MKHIKSINEGATGVIKTTDLWVVKTYSDTDIMEVYGSKRTAQKECDELEKRAYEHYKKMFKRNSVSDIHAWNNDTVEEYLKRNAPTYRVVSLYDAIEEIKEYTEDYYRSHDNPSY